jgi:hypothetical protein
MSWILMLIMAGLVASLMYMFDTVNRMHTDIKIIRKKVSTI